MKIRTRLLVWLFATTLPLIAASFIIVDRVADRLTDQVTTELTNLVRVEAQHLDGALAQAGLGASALAANDTLMLRLESLKDPALPRNGDRTLNELAKSLLDGAVDIGYNVEGVRVTDRQGVTLGQTDGFAWGSAALDHGLRAMDQRRPLVGNAYRTDDGSERYGVAGPVVAADGSVLGAVLLEYRFDVLVSAFAAYEDFGITTEAGLVQRLDDNTIEVITTRRFDRGSAFSRRYEADDRTPSVRALDSTEPLILESRDYRGVDAIAAVQQVRGTQWGLSMKMDRAEALAVPNEISRYLWIGVIAAILALLVGWLGFLRPLGRRLQRTAEASDRVARGDYHSLIGDSGSDEISDLSRSIDRLASDLKDDIEMRISVEAQLRFQANHDVLTGLMNRQRATAVIEQFADNQLFSLLFIDLDRFKQINDTHGHAIGDEVLSEIAHRLSAVLPAGSSLSRWGGDEFLAILPGVDHATCQRAVQQMQHALNDEVPTSAGRHAMQVSVGGATSVPGVSPSEVVIAADAAMFKMKMNRSRSTLVPAEVIRTVEAALAEDRIEPFYQPVVRVDSRGAVHLVGAEALVRIRMPDGSTLEPASFLPALGDHPLAARVDLRVIQRALGVHGLWHASGVVPDAFRMALNIGTATMGSEPLIETLTASIHRNDTNAALVLVEIPETVAEVDAGLLADFRTIGARVAIDDVGVQFSNLERMVDFDADVAKLDRRWIPSMATAEVSKSEVLRLLVDQCNSLDLEIIAEGIETTEQLEMLRRLGVDLFQGFLFGRPMPQREFERTWCRADAASFRGVSRSWEYETRIGTS